MSSSLKGDWNAKVGSQEIPGVTGKFGLGVQNEAEQSLTVLSKEHSGHRKHPLPTNTVACVYLVEWKQQYVFLDIIFLALNMSLIWVGL